MILEIDNREPSTIKEYFSNSGSNGNGIKCYHKNLEQGDFIIRDDNENILLIIERKTIDDLLASVKDSRYSEQSERYSNLELSNSKIYYIIEGNINRYCSDSPEYKTYYSCIFSLSFKKEFSVLVSNDITGTINLLNQFLSRMCENKEISKSKTSLSLIKKQTITLQNINSYMLNLVPSIGLSTATEILKHFDGKVYNLMKKCNQNESNESNELNNLLSNIKINNRKLSKKIIENINNYLCTN